MATRIQHAIVSVHHGANTTLIHQLVIHIDHHESQKLTCFACTLV